MKIADNPLSKNLSKIFGDVFNNEFKRKTAQVREKIYSKYGVPKQKRNRFIDSMFKNWIIGRSEDNWPSKIPTMANLIKTAEALNKDFFDLFIDTDAFVRIDNLPEKRAYLIQAIPVIPDYLITAFTLLIKPDDLPKDFQLYKNKEKHDFKVYTQREKKRENG